MRLVFLNTLNGEIKEPIKNFLCQECAQTDIFCFQEADENMKSIASDPLIDYDLTSDFKFLSPDDQFPQATYIKKGINKTNSQTILSKEPDTGLCVFTQIQYKNNVLNICNVHGISRPGDKLDTSGRIKQSTEIINFLKTIDGPKIIGGDFNLEYHTQSVKLFEQNGYRNLIKDFKISTTRNHIIWDQYPGSKQLYADFLFVSPDVNVVNFLVPDIVVSDHLPLILEIE